MFFIQGCYVTMEDGHKEISWVIGKGKTILENRFKEIQQEYCVTQYKELEQCSRGKNKSLKFIEV